MAPLLAHAGELGLHDAVWFAVPVVLGLAALRFAERKAAARARDDGEDEGGGDRDPAVEAGSGPPSEPDRTEEG